MILLDKQIQLMNGFEGFIKNGTLYHLDGTVVIKDKPKRKKRKYACRKYRPVLVEKEVTYTYYV